MMTIAAIAITATAQRTFSIVTEPRSERPCVLEQLALSGHEVLRLADQSDAEQVEGDHQSHRISLEKWWAGSESDGGHGQPAPVTRSRAGAMRMARKTTPSRLIGMLSFSPISLARASSACSIAERMAAERARSCA